MGLPLGGFQFGDQKKVAEGVVVVIAQVEEHPVVLFGIQAGKLELHFLAHGPFPVLQMSVLRIDQGLIARAEHKKGHQGNQQLILHWAWIWICCCSFAFCCSCVPCPWACRSGSGCPAPPHFHRGSLLHCRSPGHSPPSCWPFRSCGSIPGFPIPVPCPGHASWRGRPYRRTKGSA